MGTLAFFPWLKIAAPVAVDGFELLPYQHDKPFSADPTTASQVASILAPYWRRFDLASRNSVILQRPGHGLFDDVDEQEIGDLYVFAEWLAFSGLAARRYFRHDGYWNRDHFRLIVQRFSGDRGGVTMTSRRRDGQATTFAPAQYFRVIRPEHVDEETANVDVDLLRALLAHASGSGKPDLYAAVVTFNMANTDAPHAPPHVEVIMSASAYQAALECKTSTDRELGEKFEQALVPSEPTPISSGRLGTLKNQPPQAQTVRQLWIRDLYRLRNDLAHGKVNPRFPSIWKVDEHLLLSAFVFPLLVKNRIRCMKAVWRRSDETRRVASWQARRHGERE